MIRKKVTKQELMLKNQNGNKIDKLYKKKLYINKIVNIYNLQIIWI
jgi:hypothetical protein